MNGTAIAFFLLVSNQSNVIRNVMSLHETNINQILKKFYIKRTYMLYNQKVILNLHFAFLMTSSIVQKLYVIIVNNFFSSFCCSSIPGSVNIHVYVCVLFLAIRFRLKILSQKSCHFLSLNSK